MSKRLIALLLCACMLIPLFTGSVSRVHAEGSNGTLAAYQANIGKRAMFNSMYIPYGSFPVSDDPEQEAGWASASQVLGEEVSPDTIVIIEDVYLNESQGIYWYKIKPAEGYTLPELMIAEPWIFQNVVGDSTDYDSLILLEEEPEPTEPTEPEPTEPTEPEPTEPEPTEPENPAPDPCPVCGIYSCGKIHLYCPVCGEFTCDISHIYCDVCGEYDCGMEHEDIYKPITSPVIPQNPSIPENVAFGLVDAEGNLVDGELVLQPGMKTSISAWTTLEGEVSYRWQVRYDAGNDLWVDIQGETGKGLLTSPAMFKGILEDQGMAMLRCVADSGDQQQISEPISVRIGSQGSVWMLPRGTGAELTADEGSDLEKAYLVVEYVYEGGRVAAAPHVAELTPGVAVKYDAHKIPVILGYTAILEINPYPDYVTMDVVDSEQALKVNIPAGVITGNVEFKVTYKPTQVSYKVIHYQQNVTGSEYTKVAEETGTQYTGQIIENVHKEYTGFYNLIYETPAAAADGSTVIEIYYDRNYYLMKFDLGGGYGVDPIYDRYGAAVAVGTPTRPGYTFLGWVDKNGNAATIPNQMPDENTTYVARWSAPGTAEYTIIYWKENADDNGYSFWAKESATAAVGSLVSGPSKLPNNVTDTAYFTYNDAMTDKNVVVAGDGSTVVNVYYTRNYYTVVFYYDGDCKIEEHVHGADCVRDVICNNGGHKHTEECVSTLACTKVEHTHDASCVCTLPAHVHGSADCNCTIPVHPQHTEACCTKTVHGNNDHSTTCWSGVGASVNRPNSAPQNPSNGYVYKRNNSTYIYINGTWYRYSGSTTTGNIAPTTCHKHDDGSCSYADELHTHGDDKCTCDLAEHSHADGNCVYDHGEHTHSSACYTYECGANDHEHVEACYRDCTKYAHTHGSSCNYSSSNSKKIFRVITAKYEADISDQWPTADDLPNLSYWSGVANQSSKLITLTSDYCDTAGKKLLANTNTTKNTLNYWFEHFDQTVEPDGITYKERNGVIYKLSDKYSQTAYYNTSNNSTWSYKKITGMTGVESSASRETGNVFNLYYTRNRVSLTFYNVNDDYATVTNIMFEQPLKNYRDSNGKLLSSYVPPEPVGAFEPGSRVFVGWYTTGECLPGTEVNFDQLTMPNNNLTIYAKWEPKKFVLDMYLDSSLGEIFRDLGEVYYGEVLGALEEPAKDGYRFVGWFYEENGVEHAFDPENMPVKGGWKIYAKWTSDELYPYTIQFLHEKEDGTIVQVAPPITGSGIAGNSYTFEAKAGRDLDTAYQSGFFPDVVSHTLNVEIPQEGENVEDPNVFTFWYKEQDKVLYTVRYLAEDGTELIPSETYESSNVVVTENFVYIKDYVPDAFQKTLLLSTTGENVITFRYTYDIQNALYVVNHWVEYKVLVEYEDGRKEWKSGGYTLRTSTQGMEKIGTTVSAEPISIEGYDLDTMKTQLTDGKLSDQVVAEGLQLNFYYTPEMRDYQFNFWLRGTNTDLAEPVKGQAPYGATVAQSAVEIVMDLDGDGINEDYRLYNPAEEIKYMTIGSLTNQDVFYYVRATQKMTITAELENHAQFPDETPPESFSYQLKIHAPNFHRDSYTSSKGELKPTLVNGEYVLQFTLNVGETIEIQELPTAEYTLTELNVPLGYYDEYSPEKRENGRYRLTVDEQVDIVVTNKYEPAVLQISKEVVGTAPEQRDFEFVITFFNNVTPDARYGYTVYGPEDGDVETRFVEPDGTKMTITLQHGQTAQFVNLPLGTYTVKEADYSQDYKTSYCVNDASSYTDGYRAEIGLLQNVVTKVQFRNAPLGADFTIQRTNAANDGQVFVYTVRKIENSAITMTVTVTVTGNGSTTIHDLPLGDYVVTQENGWSWRYSDGQQTVTHDHSDGTTVTFGGSWIDRWLNGNSIIKRNIGGG